jgi:hypothetical protein
MGRVVVLATMALWSAGCGSSFSAVQAAGAAGLKIDANARALAAAEAVCAETRALGGTAPKDCPAVGQAAADWRDKVSATLVAYAKKLTALSQQKDVAVKDQVDTALGAASAAQWDSLKKDPNSALAEFANAVVGVLSMEYRAGVLDDAIRSTNPSLQRVAKLVEDEVDLRVGQIDALSGAARQLTLAVQHTPPAKPLPPMGSSRTGATAVQPAEKGRARDVAAPISKEQSAINERHDGFDAWQSEVDHQLEGAAKDQAAANTNFGEATGASLAMLTTDLALKKQAYLDLKKSVQAFAAAHQKLAEHVGDLGAGDLLPQVVAVIQSAASAGVALQPASGDGSAGGHSSSGGSSTTPQPTP